MIPVPQISRPPRALVEGLANIGSATASSELYKLGIRNPFMRGPAPHTKGKRIAGPAITLQFMPKREDLYGESEYTDREKQLHRHALYQAEPGDIVVVDARGDMDSGIFGEMMLTYFAGKGGAGMVIDGCIRDSAKAFNLDLGLWLRGTTPNFHTQTVLMPHAVNIPIACGGAYVVPGDIIIADDDGAVVVPIALAEEVLRHGSQHADWEDFSREQLARGGDLRRYYPLAPEAEEEFARWQARQSRPDHE
ncbi:Dimethylmenaquinone methyltransferase [Hyphomicrobiales bacterium]|nr:Dimethylmenaquinone methyltransferase [Hyphomicrobiales bacterium]CAH1694044.1 Dimethylmenaquinone methyltransferase [Hyphomicrobiales bacterium]